MHRAVKLGLTGRFDQEIMQFLGALAIAPVADPDEVLLRRRRKQRAEHGVSAASCQVKTRRPQPKPFVAAAQGFAERQHGIIVL